MDSGRCRGEQDAWRAPAGASGVTTEMGSYMASVVADVLTKRREKDDLDAKTQERHQVLEHLQQRIQDLQKKVKEVEEFNQGAHRFIKGDNITQLIAKAEREREGRLENQTELMRLKEQYTQLTERKQQLLQLLQRHTLYGDFMERVVKMTKFEDVQSFMVHVENLLQLRDQLSEKEKKEQEEVEQLRKELQTLEDQHRVRWLHMNNQRSQLHKELNEMSSEALTWERKWNHILETAAKKTLLLVKIKMATLNLYEMIEEKAEEEECVSLNETEKQLDRVKMFIQDYAHARTQLQMEKNRTEKEQGKK